MTSYEDKLKSIEKAIDKSAAIPQTSSFVRTVGFGSSDSGSVPVSIPNSRATKKSSSASSVSPQSELNKYKSQLQGWSTDGKEDSILSSSPRSFEARLSTSASPQTRKLSSSVPPTTSTSTQQTSPVSKDKPKQEPTPVTSNNATQLPGKVKMSKEERKALYEKQSQAAQQRRQKGEGQDTATEKTATKPQEKQGKPQQQKQEKPQQPKQEKGQPKQEKPQQPKQEKQAKPAAKKEAVDQKAEAKPTPAKVVPFDDPKKAKASAKKKVLQPTEKQVSLFSHLPQFIRPTSSILTAGFGAEVHPAMLELGLKYAQGVILGSNARCVAMLEAFQRVIKDFKPPNDDFFRDFDIKPSVQCLVDCRPISVSMGNAINYIKHSLLSTKTMDTAAAKEFMIEKIQQFIQERILIADEMIVKYGSSKIVDGDVILTYARSHVVEMILSQAQGKKFKVVIVDSQPKREGKELLRRLVKLGIKCTFVALSSISFIMPNVTKIFVGAHTMMANGNLLSRVGTALIAMMAKNYHVPFIACCETYKFTDRVQLESISFNELGDPDELVQTDNEDQPSKLKGWKDTPNLRLLNLMYDLTPAEFIVMVITEVGMVPPSSVPVIIREYRKEPGL